MIRMKLGLMAAGVGVALLTGTQAMSQSAAPSSGSTMMFSTSDPGVRCGDLGAGGQISGLSTDQQTFFTGGLADFQGVESVADGLGPR